MPRPIKWRRVCSLPERNRFGPLDANTNENHIKMTVDEYETIRLIDLEGFTQEECAKQMNVLVPLLKAFMLKPEKDS